MVRTPNMPMNRWKPRLAWLSLCVFAFIFPAQAGAAEPPDASFIVDAWSTKEGLPQSSVISVIQTRDGYLWLGTLNGLVRFDGNHFTIFDENNTPGLKSERIVFLFEDSHTNFWVGMDMASVVLVKNGNVKSFDLGHAGHEGRILYAYEDVTGTVWFYTADGHASRYEKGKMETDPSLVSVELVFRATRSLVPSQSGGFWLLQNGRVQKWTGNQMQRDLGACPWGTNTIVTSACEDSDGNLIVGTLGEGVFWFDADGNYRQISTDQGLSIRRFFPCAWIAREIFGWEPTAAVWIESKEKFSALRPNIVRGLSNRYPGTRPGVYGRLSTRTACLIGSQTPCKILAWVGFQCLDGAGGSPATSLGGHPGRRIFSSFKPIIFSLRPARKTSGRNFSPCLKIIRDGCGWAPRMVWRAGTERIGKSTRPPDGSRGSRHCRGCRRQSLDWNRKPRVVFFQGWEIDCLSGSGRWIGR